MRARQFFVVSLLLAVLAVAVQFQAMSQTSLGIQAIARATPRPEAERDAARSLARHHAEQGAFIRQIGAVIAVASVGFVVASNRQREPARRSVTIAVLSFYAITLLILV